MPARPSRELEARCWRCNTTSVVNASTGGTLALGISFEGTPEGALFHALTKYGHAWETIEKFYRCLLGRSRWPVLPQLPARVVLPGRVANVWVRGRPTLARRVQGPVFRELQAIFNGTLLAVERDEEVDGLPVCCDQACCPARNTSSARLGIDSAGGVAQLHVRFMARWFMPAKERREMRAFIYRNMGFEATTAVDTFYFVSSRSPSNTRRLVGEDELVEHLHKHIARHHPGLRFFYQVPGAGASASFADQARWLRRTRVFVSLFSSALHSCRLLPPGSIVVEIHGALLNDWSDSGYAWLCAEQMGLRWVGVAADDAVPAFEAAADRLQRLPDFSHARVNASLLLEVIDAALRADWRAAFRAYPLPVLGPVSNSEAQARLARNISAGRVSGLEQASVQTLLRMPQYRSLEQGATQPPEPAGVGL